MAKTNAGRKWITGANVSVNDPQAGLKGQVAFVPAEAPDDEAAALEAELVEEDQGDGEDD